MGRHIAIRAENLGKQYRIGETIRYKTLRESLTNFFDLSKSSESETIWALRNFSFDITQGDVVGIIGPNGSGKSTLLKLLARITKPTEGGAEIFGRVGSLLEVGTGFHPELTGRENIYLNGAILGMTKQEIRVKFDEIVEFAGVGKYLDTPVKRYSSGMGVRLAFAVAAHLEPEILLVDEVLAVGDSAFQKRCLGKIQEVSKEGRTVLFVSHNMAAIESLCNRGFVISGGKLQFTGSVRESVDTYMATMSDSLKGGYSDLTNPSVRHRGPSALARLKSISLHDHKGDQADVLRMGKSAKFRIRVDIKNTGEDFEFGISVNNLYDVPLHFLISNWEGFEAITTVGEKVIEVELPVIHLFPGQYNVHVWVKRQRERYDDAVHDALRFRVVESQLTRSYAYFDRYSRNSQVYTPASWRLIGS